MKNSFRLNFGSVINESLFDLNTNLLEYQMKLITLLNYEPRISNIKVKLYNYPDSHELNATIQYDITGIPKPTQEVDVLLIPARV